MTETRRVKLFATYQVIGSSGNMHKENAEVSNFCSQFGAPRYFALQHHLVGINVVEVRTLRQEEHPLFREESFLLVKNSLLDDEVAFHETVEVVVLGLVLEPEAKIISAQKRDSRILAADLGSNPATCILYQHGT